MATNGSEVDIPALIAQGVGVARWGYLLLGTAGVLCNLPVIYISLKPGLVEREFKWFILNLSFVDTIGSFMFLGASFAYAMQADYPRPLCSITGVLFYYNAFSVFWVLFPVTINRFINTFAAHRADMFTPGVIVCLCLLIDMLPVLQISTFGMVGDWSQVSSTGSCTLVVAPHMRQTYARLFTLNQAINWAVFGTTSVLNMALHVKIRKHLAVVTSIADKKRMKETRDLVRATMFQVITPAALQLPVSLTNAIIVSYTANATEQLVAQLIYLVPMLLLLALNPTADALLSLYMLKPYRRAVVGFWKQFKGQPQSTTAAAQLVVPASGGGGSAPQRQQHERY